MADFVTGLRDVMNPHTLFVIKVPAGMDADSIQQLAEEIEEMMKRWHVVTWGWQMASSTIKFRVYEPDCFTALGRLEEAGFKREKEKEPSSPFLPPRR
jgi:diaminopimelate epimerase